MRQVYKGNVSVPLHIIERFLKVSQDPKASIEEMSEVAREMTASLKEAKRRIDEGLDQSNLTVCIGKLGYINAIEARNFLSGEQPRITIYRKSKSNHDMALYFKHKPSEYVARAARKAKQEGKQHDRNGKQQRKKAPSSKGR